MTSKKRDKGRNKSKDMTATFLVNRLFIDSVKRRASKLDMNLSAYIIAVLIFDIRFGDATDHIKQLQKNYSIAHLTYPGIDKENDAKIIKYWREKQRDILAGVNQGKLKFDDVK
ncbi:MAG: hypothetical protein IH949_10625 [Bacteroidetes bacterium]|nr:hypothetical protein [Bacteroidota bacterium]